MAFKRGKKTNDKWNVIPHWTVEIRKANKSPSFWMAPGDMCSTEDLVGGVCDWHPLFGPREERAEYKDIVFRLQRPQYPPQQEHLIRCHLWGEHSAVHSPQIITICICRGSDISGTAVRVKLRMIFNFHLKSCGVMNWVHNCNWMQVELKCIEIQRVHITVNLNEKCNVCQDKPYMLTRHNLRV